MTPFGDQWRLTFLHLSGLFYSEKSSSRNAKANEMTHFQIGGQNGWNRTVCNLGCVSWVKFGTSRRKGVLYIVIAWCEIIQNPKTFDNFILNFFYQSSRRTHQRFIYNTWFSNQHVEISISYFLCFIILKVSQIS